MTAKIDRIHLLHGIRQERDERYPGIEPVIRMIWSYDSGTSTPVTPEGYALS